MSFRLLLYVLILIPGVFRAGATHIVGGEITYRHLGNDSFAIRLDLYVDCINGSQAAINDDTQAMLGFFDTSRVLIKSLLVTRTPPQRINSVNYDCIIPPSNACVDKYSYYYYTRLPQIPGGYIITFQRCCRNGSINNIVNPLSTGATYWSLITDTAQSSGYNNSAVFRSLPPNFICNGRDFIFDHSATDIDGDSLSYSLYTPFIGASSFNSIPRPPSAPPYSGITWLPPYSEAEMMRGNPELKIDPVSGLLTVKPAITGQFVVGIAAHEYRQGKLINTLRRDFQFNVLNCQFNTVSVIGTNISLCSDTVRFINQSLGADTYYWDFGVASTGTDTSTLFEPQYIYPGPGIYTVKLRVSKGNCSDSSESLVEILKDTARFAGPDTSICYGEQLQFGSMDSGFAYVWSPALYLDNPYLARPTSTPVTTISYTGVRSNAICSNTDTIVIHVRKPEAAFSITALNGCTSASLLFDSVSPNTLSWILNGDTIAFDRLSALRIAHGQEYRIALVVHDERCLDTLEKTIITRSSDTIDFIPNVFTPNHDGWNDCYSIPNLQLTKECNRLIVYNRWGAPVYDSNEDGSCWNGNSSNGPVPEGVYFYLLEHRNQTFHGTITLKRE